MPELGVPPQGSTEVVLNSSRRALVACIFVDPPATVAMARHEPVEFRGIDCWSGLTRLTGIGRPQVKVKRRDAVVSEQ